MKNKEDEESGDAYKYVVTVEASERRKRVKMEDERITIKNYINE